MTHLSLDKIVFPVRYEFIWHNIKGNYFFIPTKSSHSLYMYNTLSYQTHHQSITLHV